MEKRSRTKSLSLPVYPWQFKASPRMPHKQEVPSAGTPAVAAQSAWVPARSLSPDSSCLCGAGAGMPSDCCRMAPGSFRGSRTSGAQLLGRRRFRVRSAQFSPKRPAGTLVLVTTECCRRRTFHVVSDGATRDDPHPIGSVLNALMYLLKVTLLNEPRVICAT